MARLLFIVSDVFLIRARGLVVFPGIIAICDERFHIGDPLLLKRPDGSSIEGVISGLDRLSCTTDAGVPVLLKGLGKEDVPIGTEVWSLDRKMK